MQRSVGQFCSIVVATIVGSSNSIASLDADGLGEGAEAFCVENKGVYRLVFSVIAQASPTYITANNGYTWALQSAEYWFSETSNITASFTPASGQTPGVNIWTAPKTGANFYAATNPGSFWSVNTTSGLMTMSASPGPLRAFLCTISMSVTSSADTQIELNLSVNGLSLGGSAAVPGSSISLCGNGFQTYVAFFRNSVWAPASSFWQPMWRINSSSTVQISTVVMQMTPIGIKY